MGIEPEYAEKNIRAFRATRPGSGRFWHWIGTGETDSRGPQRADLGGIGRQGQGSTFCFTLGHGKE